MQQQVKLWINGQSTKVTSWIDRSVSVRAPVWPSLIVALLCTQMDQWQPVAAHTPYSTSAVDTFTILFSMQDLFFANLTQLLQMEGLKDARVVSACFFRPEPIAVQLQFFSALRDFTHAVGEVRAWRPDDLC